MASTVVLLSYRKQLRQRFLTVCGRKSCSGESSYNDQEDSKKAEKHFENSGKLIQLVVTSLRVDRVAASGLGLARR